MCKPTIIIDEKYTPAPTCMDSFNTTDYIRSKCPDITHLSGTVNGIRFAFNRYFDDGFIGTSDPFERDYVRLALHHYILQQWKDLT